MQSFYLSLFSAIPTLLYQNSHYSVLQSHRIASHCTFAFTHQLFFNLGPTSGTKDCVDERKLHLCWFICSLFFLSFGKAPLFSKLLTFFITLLKTLAELLCCHLLCTSKATSLYLLRYVLTHTSPWHLQPNSIIRSLAITFVSSMKCPNSP